jgi:DNA modification methylase
MKEKDILSFNPDVLGVYLKKLQDVIEIYITAYFPKLTPKTKVTINYSQFNDAEDSFDLVLTSPPYGDSRTTVAYGQFSTLANEWIGIDYARKVDKMLMGGSQTKSLYNQGLITDYIQAIAVNNEKRALEVSAFYVDLEKSIDQVAKSVKKGGKIIYVVGNRTVKNIQLPTDQFIAEKFEQNGFRHLITYERLLSNKAMPSKNSPTNESGNTVNTMLYEYIVISEKY